MNIYKAIKQEKKFLKRFYIIMIFLSIILPFIAFLTNATTFFYLSYLSLIEILIFLAILSKINYHRIKFSCNNNKLKIKSGIFSKESLILCDKVVLVHTEKMEDEMDIIIVTSVKVKNRGLKLVTRGVLKRYPKMKEKLIKIKELNENTVLYYQVIRKGGLKKYLLLDTIYKSCVKATFTEDCIQNIKIARGQTLV